MTGRARRWLVEHWIEVGSPIVLLLAWEWASASGVLRFTSVSSMRRMNWPPVCRASRKLYRAVRAPPMWVWPVGEGA